MFWKIIDCLYKLERKEKKRGGGDQEVDSKFSGLLRTHLATLEYMLANSTKFCAILPHFAGDGPGWCDWRPREPFA